MIPIFSTVLLVAFMLLAGCVTPDKQPVLARFAPLNVATANQQIADSSTPLQLAARDGDAPAVSKLLLQGAPVNTASSLNGETPLILAATMGHARVAEALLEAGADVNAIDHARGTALMYASSKGYVDIVKSLLQHAADVNRQSPADQLDSTALTLAAGNGHAAVLELLLQAGADIDWRTQRDALSALMLAAELGHWRSVKLLLSAGANPDLSGRPGHTACTLANANGHAAVAQVLDEFYLVQGQGKRCRPDSKKTSGRDASP